MIVLGIYSIFQVIFLPGFLFIKLFKIPLRGLNLIVYSFGLSFIINYLFVLTLTTLGIYLKTIVYILFVIQFALLLIILKKEKFSFKTIFLKTFIRLRDILSLYDTSSSILQRNLYKLTVFISFYMIIHFFIIFIDNIGTIFTSWDAVISWNRWATIWAKNEMPKMTAHYPQLLPINWSITYLFIGNSSISYFAKSIMSLFPLFTLIILFKFAVMTKKFVGFIPILIAYFLYTNYMGYMLSKGYADIPVAFFSFLAIFMLYISFNISSIINIEKYVILGAVFAAGAAVTKQAGIFIMLIYPVLFYIFSKKNKISKKIVLILLILIIGINLVIAGSWYIYKEIQISNNTNRSEIKYVSETIHKGKTYVQRFEKTVRNYPLLYVFIILGLFSMSNFFLRHIYFLLVIPFTLLWAIFFSYSFRNCTLILPAVAITSGYGIYNILFFSHRKAKKIRLLKFLNRINVFNIFLIISILVFIIAFFFPNKLLINKSRIAQKRIGYYGLNNSIYKYKKKYGIRGKILSDYQFLKHLPGFGLKHYKHFTFTRNNRKKFIQLYNRVSQEPGISYILAPLYMNNIIKDHINKRIDKKDYKMIFMEHGYIFVKIVKK